MIKTLSKRFSKSARIPDREIILHVGMDKTGTSAIQAFLHKNRELLLEEAGVYYPETGIWSDYSHHPYAFSLFGINGFSVRDFLKLSRKLDREARGEKSVLISSECLFKAPTRDEFDVFTNFIGRHFSSVKVIVYLRRQDLWVESRHKHSIISGHELSIEKLSTPHFCNYKKFIDLWRDEYGLENIIVRPYEKAQFEGGSIFSDFLSIFDIKLDDRWELPGRQVNAGLGNIETDFKRFCNEIGFSQGLVDRLNGLLVEHAGPEERKGKESLISKAQCVDLMERYRPINNSIADEYMATSLDTLFREEVEVTASSSWSIFGGMTDAQFFEILDFIKERDLSVYNKIRKLAIKENLDLSQRLRHFVTLAQAHSG